MQLMVVENKFNLIKEQNIFLAKKTLPLIIYNSAKLEGIKTTYPDTKTILDGGIINGLTVANVISINNLKYAWQFILEENDIKNNYASLCQIHKLTCDKLVLSQLLGKIRTIPVSIGRTN